MVVPMGGPDGGPVGGPDGGPVGGPVGGPEASPFEGLEDAPSGDLDGRLGGVGADEIGAVGIAGGVGALTVSSTAGWFVCNRMSFCGLLANTSSEVVTELDSSSAVVSVLGDEKRHF